MLSDLPHPFDSARQLHSPSDAAAIAKMPDKFLLERVQTMRPLAMLVMTVGVLFATEIAFAQRDAGSKIRGEYNFYGGSAARSMRGARESSQAYREYTRSAPQQKVNPEVAREAADSIGDYIAKAQRHFAWMRKQAVAAKDTETLTSLDGIDKNLADAAKSHAEMRETCLKDPVDAGATLDCCKVIDDSLAKAIADHDKLMKRLAGGRAAAAKK